MLLRSRSLLPLVSVFSLAALAACDGKAVVETENHPPGAPDVSVGPTDPHTGDDLVAVILSPSRDPEDDAVTYRYAWLQNGLPRADLTSDTVPASETARGDTWQVVVTPNDGEADGATAEASTTVLNTIPTVTVSLSPEAPVTGDDLVATAAAEDADGDPTTVTYSWTRFGAPTDHAGSSVPASDTERGDVWSVTAVASDGMDDSEPVTAWVTVEDAAPEVISVELAPADPTVGTSILAVVDAFDADLDAVTYRYRWFADGDVIQVGTSDTLEPGLAAKHQLVSVEVTPNDGILDGTPFTSTDVTVRNTPPSGVAYTEPMSGIYESTTVTCIGYGYADVDGDPEGWSYAWTVNGVEVSTSATIDGALFNRGDTLICTATPYDGEEFGDGFATTPLKVLNSAPVVGSAVLSTDAPTEADTLSVSADAVVDDDGDAVTYQYAWYVDGVYVSSSITLPPTRFAKGDTVYAVLTPFDGYDYGTPVTSETATVANSAPVVSAVTLTPDALYTDETLTASVTATDADGDTLRYHYAWYVDGAAAGADASTLDGAAYFDRDQEVYVVVTASDGDADSADRTSDTVTVLDSAPTAPEVAVTPTDAAAGDDLTCSVVTESVDADGDPVTYAFAWDVDGVAFHGATTGAMSSSVPGADVGDFEAWTCEVTPSAGSVTGSVGADTVIVSFFDYTATYGFTMVAIPAGTFVMGSTTGDADEAPVHAVTLTHNFWMSQTEVTQAEYRAGTGANPSYFSGCGLNCPVEQVTWYEAAKYANALSTAEGLALCYTASGSDLAPSLAGDPYACEGYRLPTEAEWEYAANAAEGYTYAGSNSVGAVAWYATNSGSTPHAVAGRTANGFGLYDLSGNVWEWTTDRYGAYSAGPATDPVGPSSGSYYVFRGGSWGNDASDERVSSRNEGDPGFGYNGVGIRLVRSAP